MGKPATNDFIVNTDGSCFLCLRKISTNDDGSEFKQLPIHSIQLLSRYLKVDMGKVFHDKGLTPQKLLGQVESSRLKVELCQGCASLTKSFSALYQQREKIDLEMLACLSVIQKKLENQKATNSVSSKLPVPDLHTERGLMIGRIEVPEALRKEVAQKCFRKLGKVIPRVEVHKLNAEKLLQQRIINQIKSFNETSPTASTPEIEAVEVKIERPDSSSVPGLAQDLDVDSSTEDQFLNQDSDHSKDDSSYEEEPNETVEKCKAIVLASSSTKRPPPIIIIPPKSMKKVENCPSIFDPTTGKHKCTLCSHQFTQKIAVQYHYESIHLKVKYKCSLCGNLFNQRPSYTRHYRRDHLGMRVQCQKCNKVFTGKSYLYTHLRKAACGEGWTLKAREKPSTVCPHCGKVFGRLDNMRAHVKRIHPKNS